MEMQHLTGSRIYSCSNCKTHLATDQSLVPGEFYGDHGRAYLFDGVVNVVEREPKDRQMTTGNHTIRNINCCKCGTTLGWKYDYAQEQWQKHKEGKFIMERDLLIDVK